MIKHTFIKAERLTGKTTIDLLFSSSKSFFYYPYRIVYRVLEAEVEQEFSCRLLVNVPKRLHKTAVARNLLKRRVHEIYRLDKHDFYSVLGDKRIHLAILYSTKNTLDSETLSTKWVEAKARLLKELSS